MKETLHCLIDESGIKLARASVSQGRKVVTGLYYKDITGMQPSDQVRELRAGLQALGVKSKQIHVLLASKYIITKSIEVPSLDPKEIEDIVRLQAVRHTPYSKEEVIVSHINLDVLLERYTKALLVIASNENVRKKTDVADAAGLDVSSVRLVPEAVTRTMQAFAPEMSDGGYVYLDRNSTDLVIINKGKPNFVRSIPIGVSQIRQDAEGGIKLLLDEIKKTLDAYQSEDPGSAAKHLALIGLECAEQAVLKQRLEADLAIKSEAAFLESKLPVEAAAKKAMSDHKEVSFLDIMCDALVGEECAVDLIPEDLRIKKNFKAKGQEIFLAGCFIMVIFILAMSVFLVKIYFRNSYLKEIHSNFEVKEKEASELMVLSEDTRQIENFNKKKGRALTVFNEIQTVLPQEMYLSETVLGSDEKVSIKGTSEFMSAVFSFVTEFESNPYFRNVTTDYTKSRRENDRDVSDFGITASVEGLGASDIKPEASAAPAEAAAPAEGGK